MPALLLYKMTICLTQLVTTAFDYQMKKNCLKQPLIFTQHRNGKQTKGNNSSKINVFLIVLTLLLLYNSKFNVCKTGQIIKLFKII